MKTQHDMFEFDGDDVAGRIGGAIAVTVYSIATFNPETHPLTTFFEGAMVLVFAILKFAALAIFGGFLGKFGKDLYDRVKDAVTNNTQ
jgi:hypothetical protein